jgi:hypothetical protein
MAIVVGKDSILRRIVNRSPAECGDYVVDIREIIKEEIRLMRG